MLLLIYSSADTLDTYIVKVIVQNYFKYAKFFERYVSTITIESNTIKNIDKMLNIIETSYVLNIFKITDL